MKSIAVGGVHMRAVITIVMALVMLVVAGPAMARSQLSGSQASAQFKGAPTGQQYRVRLNRGLVDTVGQQPNVARICGPQGAHTVNTRRNGWDVLLTAVTIGMYTPAHSYIVCNSPIRS
jgi:hypothetical protein